jgi:hypothetical protein
MELAVEAHMALIITAKNNKNDVQLERQQEVQPF